MVASIAIIWVQTQSVSKTTNQAIQYTSIVISFITLMFSSIVVWMTVMNSGGWRTGGQRLDPYNLRPDPYNPDPYNPN